MYYETPMAHTQLPGQVQIRADVFPAAVGFSFAPSPQGKARVIVTADVIQVMVDGYPTPNLVYEGRLENVSGDRNTLVATTADGEVTVQRANGCGCGSALKSYRAYKSSVRMATPR